MITLLLYPFVQNAFLAGTLVAVIAAFVGYFLLARGLTFAGHALSQMGFAGAAGALVLGIDPVFGLLFFTVTSGIAIGYLGKQLRERDITIGILMVFVLGLGSLFLSLYNGYAQRAYSILFGTILGITRFDVLITCLFCLITFTALLVMYRPLLFSSFDPEVAQARGVPVRLLAILFLILVAITVSVAVQVVGVLLIFTLLVGPPATAIRIVHSPSRAILLAIILGVLYTWLGIFFALTSTIPVSFYIAALSFGIYVPIRLYTNQYGKRGKK